MDGSGRDDHDQEHIIFDMISSSQNPKNEPADDDSQYLNHSGEGIKEEPRHEEHTNNDGEGNVFQLTKIYSLTRIIQILRAVIFRFSLIRARGVHDVEHGLFSVSAGIVHSLTNPEER